MPNLITSLHFSQDFMLIFRILLREQEMIIILFISSFGSERVVRQTGGHGLID